jgi:hypothetical protein
MRTSKLIIAAGILLLCAPALVTAQVQTDHRVGIRAGIGTDISLGIAYGAGANYLVDLSRNKLELGIVLFGGSFDESSDEGIHTYDETTDIVVFGILANYLIGYAPDQSSSYFIAGFGLASVSIEWEERSSTDNSLGTPLDGGGSLQSVDASTGGTVFNLGFGKSFGNGFDVRAEAPVIVSFAAPGNASSVIPTFMVTAGLRF